MPPLVSHKFVAVDIAEFLLFETRIMRTIGYARVSTAQQKLARQIARLEQAGCERIFTEHASGAAGTARPELDAALSALDAGDVLCVTALDRLVRSVAELLTIVRRIDDAGAGLRSLTEPWADTTSAQGRFVMTVFTGLAEFERSLISARCREGIERARAAGVRFGAPRKLCREQVRHAADLVAAGYTVTAAARIVNVNRSTLYRALARGRSEGWL